MSDRSKKITELTQVNGCANGDLLLIVTNPTSNTPTTKSISVQSLFSNSDPNVVINAVTPANSTVNTVPGTLTYDSNYLYVSVANNLIKRITLESF